MAPTEKLLREIIAGQAVLVTEVKTLNVRLFGGDGQKGVVPILFEKNEKLDQDIQDTKDKITVEIGKLHEAEIKPVQIKVADLENKSSNLAWKLGSVSAVGGSILGAAIAAAAKRLFGVH